MLELRAVRVRIGGQLVLDDVSFAVPAGGICGLIGPNGAGKTTLFDVVTGLRRPDGGAVHLDGRDLGRTAPHRRARAGLARTFQSLQLFGALSVRHNLLVGTSDGTRAEREAEVDRLLAFLDLEDVADRPAGTLPTGTGRRVELGRALAGGPRLLLLDEPASGQSAEETEALADLLRRVSASGVGILLVEHDVPLVMDLCSVVHVLDFGRLIASGPPAAVRADPAVQAAYLGVATGAAS